jgi:hypothetical protein
MNKVIGKLRVILWPEWHLGFYRFKKAVPDKPETWIYRWILRIGPMEVRRIHPLDTSRWL